MTDTAAPDSRAPGGEPSVTVTATGTRGARFPRSLARVGNAMVVRMFRRRGSARTQGGVDAFLVETIGAKSGQKRQALLGHLPDGHGGWLVIASAVGAARHPAWLHNLAADPNAVVEFGDGRRVDVRAETLQGDELARAWQRIAVDAPEYVKYRSKTDREIPVVRLRPR